MALLLLRLIASGCITSARSALFAVVFRLPLRSYMAAANVEPQFRVGWGWAGFGWVGEGSVGKLVKNLLNSLKVSMFGCTGHRSSPAGSGGGRESESKM